MNDLEPEDYQAMADLFEAAWVARENAYAPYSRYPVGAAVLGADGKIWTGCNVENVSFPVGVCAERNAIANMVLSGCREIRNLVVVTQDGGTPCGACLQAILEFSPNPTETRVYLGSPNGEIRSYALLEMIPHGFRSGNV